MQKIVIREVQSENILLKSMTFEVLNLLRSSDVNASHPGNMPPMSVTFSELRFRMPLMSCKLMQYENQERVLVGRNLKKEVSNTACLIFVWSSL